MVRAMYVMYVMMPGPLRGMLAKREAGPSEGGFYRVLRYPARCAS